MTDHAAQLGGLLRREEEEVVVEDASEAEEDVGGGRTTLCLIPVPPRFLTRYTVGLSIVLSHVMYYCTWM